MSSSSIVLTLVYASQQVMIYAGLTVFGAGIIGSLLNIITFLSLKTFREKSSAFYLTITSFINILNLTTAFLSRILISGFNIDWTSSSSVYCKLRIFMAQFSILTSFACTCLAAMDQYFSTCPYPRLRQWSNIKVSRLLTVIFMIVWVLHGIPYLIYHELVQSPVTGASMCIITNVGFQKYYTYCYVIFLICFLPLLISGSFGLAAYRNIQNLAHQTIPMVRRYSEIQLTKMVFNQLLFDFIFTSPYAILTIITALMPNVKDPVIKAQLNFANVLAMLLFYFSFACPFYVFVASSERFRKQLRYVLFEIHLKQLRKNTTAINQVAPESEQRSNQ